MTWEFDAYSFSETIRDRRKSMGLTQGELADRAGCNLITIVNYESGYRLPRIDILLKLAKALGFDDIRFKTDRKWYL